jgi:hypothetical protein
VPDHVADALKAAVAIRTGAGCQNVVTRRRSQSYYLLRSQSVYWMSSQKFRLVDIPLSHPKTNSVRAPGRSIFGECSSLHEGSERNFRELRS